jgi:ElaB/YqjD/DUF883 family membrane-anchored ribosome-binding protein
MSSNANDTIDSLHRAGRDAAGDLRRRTGNVKDYASDEMRAFFADVEDLVKRVGNVSDADVARARAKVVGTLADVRRLANDTSESLRERARAAVDCDRARGGGRVDRRSRGDCNLLVAPLALGL